MGISNLGREIFRIGEVTSTIPGKGKVRVWFPDMDKLISHEMWVVFRKTRENKDYDMPDLGDQVVCAFLGNGLEAGFVLGTIYSEKDKPPVECQDKKHYAFADGTWVEYDRATHQLRAHVEGSIDIFAAGDINIESGTGRVFVTGRGGAPNIALNDPAAPENAAQACGWRAGGDGEGDG